MARAKEPPIAAQYKREFGDRLRRFRLAEELTQKEFATLLGISRDRYANYEDGSNEMPYWLLARLEMVTGKDIRFWVVGRLARDLRIPLGTLTPDTEPGPVPHIPPKAED